MNETNRYHIPPKLDGADSEWQGLIGEQIDIKVYIDHICVFEEPWGTKFMHIMHDKDGNSYKWFSERKLKETWEYHIKAIVKDHIDYYGIHQTVITRCRIIRGED